MRYSNDEVANLVKSLHKNKEDFNDGDLLERIYKYPYYKLETIPLNFIEADEWHTEEERILDYAQRGSEFPPIVLTPNCAIIDGSHRVKAAKIKNQKTILAYIAYLP